MYSRLHDRGIRLHHAPDLLNTGWILRKGYPMRILAVVAVVLLGAIGAMSAKPALSHSGALDFRGCHYDFTVSGYHCHKGQYSGRRFGSPLEMPGRSQSKPPSAQAPATGIELQPMGAQCCANCAMSDNKKACGNGCVLLEKTCDEPRGCACDRK